jgi:cathepsin D
LTFGGYNKKLFKKEPKWHENVSKKFWIVNCEKILVGKKDTKLCSKNKPCRLMVDTGSTLFSAPTEPLKKLLSNLD